MDEEGNPMVNSPEAVETLKMWLELAKYAPPGRESASSDEVKAYLYGGKAMNRLNYFLFSVSLCLTLLKPSFTNPALTVLFPLVFGVLIDLDHVLNKKAPWHHKRSWVQEPLGLVTIGLPFA